MFPATFGSFAFISPWVLAGLAFLPVLWFLLRVTPPAPRLIVFPAARFLMGLDAQKQVPSKTPWPILLLRMLALALIILALARPVMNPAAGISGNGAVRIVIDNHWASGQTWRLQTAQAQEIIEQAAREKRTIYLMTTAPEAGKDHPYVSGPLSKGEAQSLVRGLKPLAWLSDYDAALTHLRKIQTDTKGDTSNIQTFWLASGIMDQKADNLARTLQNQGGLVFMQPAPMQRPVLLRPEQGKSGALSALLEVPSQTPAGLPLSIKVMTQDGRMIDSADVTTDGKKIAYPLTFNIPAALSGQPARLQVANRDSAGSALILDSSALSKNVGVVAPDSSDKAPLTDAAHYIGRALDPYAKITKGTLANLIEQKPEALILPDVGAMPPEDLDHLEKWVRQGGLLIRFGGPNMTQGESFLTPVTLRQGGRTLEGSLSWAEPAKLAAFTESSPYFGLEIPDDLVIHQQLLAEPEPEIERKTWAALQDGTPLITADQLDKGLIVLVHTTATPTWSNLALSGLFVKILERTISMAGSSFTQDTVISGSLQPLSILDGYGRLQKPDATTHPLSPEEFENFIPDSTHPPGIYGRAGFQRSLNMGSHLPTLRLFPDMPDGTTTQLYGGTAEKDLMPPVLLLAIALFMLDWLIMIILQTGWKMTARSPRWAAAILLVNALACFMPATSFAETPEDQIRYAGEIHLAYIRTGVPEVDNLSYKGLEGLGIVLTQRTSVEPAGIVSVNLESDDLSFFPLIYWAITPGQAALSGKALSKIQDYLDHGGTILIDTRDQSSTPSGFGDTASGVNAAHLRRLLGNLNVPPLVTMPKDHVLTKSFYLLDQFSGRYNGGTLWIEENSANGRDGVSSLIIGSNDWAAGWSQTTPTNPHQQEMAYRFGVNVMMYALTGNYKADQVHIPHILERLGQ